VVSGTTRTDDRTARRRCYCRHTPSGSSRRASPYPKTVLPIDIASFPGRLSLHIVGGHLLGELLEGVHACVFGTQVLSLRNVCRSSAIAAKAAAVIRVRYMVIPCLVMEWSGRAPILPGV
jgi:hypothetical protein